MGSNGDGKEIRLCMNGGHGAACPKPPAKTSRIDTAHKLGLPAVQVLEEVSGRVKND